MLRRRAIFTTALSIVAAVIIALVCASIYEEVARGDGRVFVELKITALGSSGERPSSEVWLGELPQEIDEQQLLRSATPADGWERRGAALLSVKNQPASLRWSGRVARDSTVTLTRHPWSGRVQIDVNGEARVIDLYADEDHSGPYTVHLISPTATVSAETWLTARPGTLLLLTTTSLIVIGFFFGARDANVSLRRRWVYVAVLALGSLAWLLTTLHAARSDIAVGEISEIIGHVALVVAAQVLAVLAAGGFSRPLAALFLAANSFFLNLVFTSLPLSQPPYVVVLIIMMSVGFYLVVIDVLVRYAAFRKLAIPTGAAALLGASAFFYLPSSAQTGSPGAVSFDGVRMVEFHEKPNIYMLSFDSMIPSALAQSYLGFRPEYIDVVEAIPGIHMFRNAFADGPFTKASFNQILRLRPNNVLVDDELVRGVKPSALREIFRYNGYETYFSFPFSYFGPLQGQYLDHYWVGAPYSTCSLLKGDARYFGFYGFCMRRRGSAGSREAGGAVRSTPYDEPINRVAAQRIIELSKSGRRPFFFMNHYLFPNHTYNNLSTAEERREYEEYYRRGSKATALAITDLVSAIRQNDPTAIIYIYSDHGAWTSRALKLQDDPRFVVQDRYGIFAGIINAERCSAYFRPPKGESFQTNSRIVVSLIQCLAGGASPLTSPYDFNVIPQFDGTHRYQEYLYEQAESS